MKRSFSSYNINKYYRELNPRKIKSNYDKSDNSLENSFPFRIQNDELKYLNDKFFRDIKNQTQLRAKNILRKKNNSQRLWFKDISDETTALLDTIKVQTGINKYYNIAGSERGFEKSNRKVSSSTLCNMSEKSSKRIFSKKERIQSCINLNKKKRLFSSKFNFNKLGVKHGDASSMINSYLIRFNSKKAIFNRNLNKLNILSKTLSPKKEQDIFYNININLGTMINNQQENKENQENKKEEENIDKDVLKFLEERKNIKSYENNPEIIKLRTDYLIKFAKINEIFKKLNFVTDCFRVNIRELYDSSIKSLIRFYDACNNFLLNGIKIDENNLSNWTDALSYVYNFCSQSSKVQKLFYEEFHFLKNENYILKQKLSNQETELITKRKEINDINKLIIKYDLNSKIKLGKKQELYINNMKNKFTSQESHYVFTIHKLEQEIKNLTNVLNKNKPDLQIIDKLKEQIKNSEKTYGEEIDRLSKLIGEKSNNIQILTQRESNLYEQINELENEIANLKKKELNEKDKNVVLNAKIENLNKIKEDKNKIIEELKNNIDNCKQNDIKDNEKLKTSKIILLAPI